MTGDTQGPQETFITRFIEEWDYPKSVNRVASVTSEKILFIKRKELAMVPYELQYFRMSDCKSITYEIKWAVGPMLFGAFLLLVFCFIIWGLGFSDTGISSGTRIPVIGVFVLLPVYAIRLLIGVKRHLITFVMNDKKLKWISKGGDFKLKTINAQQLVAFAKQSGRLDSSLCPGVTELERLSA